MKAIKPVKKVKHGTSKGFGLHPKMTNHLNPTMGHKNEKGKGKKYR